MKSATPQSRSVAFRGQHAWKEIATLTAIFVGAILVSPRTESGQIIFLDPANLTDALRALVPVGVIALAMTYVILTGGIDLSVGSVVALSGVVAARLLTEWRPAVSLPAHIALAAGAAILACGLAGLLNGTLVAFLDVQPFVVTLASMIGLRGLTLLIANNERIGLGVGSNAAGHFGAVVASKGFMVATFVALAIVFLVVLNRTVFGRQLRATGDNPVAARYAGLPVRGVRIAVYTLSGLMAGVGGVLMAARTTTGDPNAGIALELDAIAVVVIGGTSLAGGRGGILGTVNGALILGILTNILGLRNVSSNAQLVLKAVIILLAVVLQRRKPRS